MIFFFFKKMKEAIVAKTEGLSGRVVGKVRKLTGSPLI